MAEVGRAEGWGGAVILEGPGVSQEVLRCPPAKAFWNGQQKKHRNKQ